MKGFCLVTPQPVLQFEDQLGHDDLVFAYSHWIGLRRDRDMPSMDDVDPLDIIPILCVVNLVDVVHQSDGSLRFRHRLLGTELVERFHAESTGDWFDELYTPEHLQRVLPDYETPVRERLPLFGDVTLNQEGKRVMAYRRLVLPFSGKSGTVERLMVVFAFDKIPDALRDRGHGLPLHQDGRGSNVPNA